MEPGDWIKQNNPQNIREHFQDLPSVQEVFDAIFNSMGDSDSYWYCGVEKSVSADKIVWGINWGRDGSG